MSALANRRFLKMNGLGNEIVIVDLRGSDSRLSAEEARAVAAEPRSRFDQLMAVHDPVTPGTDAYMRIYNTDGSQSAACGNGTRCVAWAMMSDPVMARPADKDGLLLETRAGLLPSVAGRRDELCRRHGQAAPALGRDPVARAVPGHAPDRAPDRPDRRARCCTRPRPLSMGNPHAIFWVDDVGAHDLARFGPMLENHPIFPERANISLAQIVAPDHIRLRVWERGAGLTQACGSAACAALVAAARKKLTGRRATVTLPGGDLLIEWRDDDHVLMTGPVELEWEGVLEPALFAGAA